MVCRYFALYAYLGLIAWILLWNILSPSATYPVSLILILLLAPLLALLKGMLHASRYIHAWASMIALFYFALGVSDAYADPSDRIYGIGLIILSLVWFAGAIAYLRSTKPRQSATD